MRQVAQSQVVSNTSTPTDPAGTATVRMCVGCRQRVRQSDMLRVVVRDSVLIPDRQVRQSGRGAYVHQNEACLVAAEQRRAFSRAFRTSRSLSTEALQHAIEEYSANDVTKSLVLRAETR